MATASAGEFAAAVDEAAFARIAATDHSSGLPKQRQHDV
jgi:hypothetical protein